MINNFSDYSVLMTIYERDNPDFVVEAIDSMLNQTVRTNNYVLVCDGPLNPKLNEIINKYCDMFPDIFDVYRLEKNVGLGAALKYGVEKCNNELIARMDDDDIAIDNRCEIELSAFKKDPNLVLVGSYVYEFEKKLSDQTILRKKPTDYLDIKDYSKRRNPFNHSTVMFKKSAIISVGNYSEMRTNQDVELWVRLLNNGYRCYNIPTALVYFRYDFSTYKRRKKWKNIKLLISIWKRFYKSGYCSLFDYLYVKARQICVFLTPSFILRAIYKKTK